MKRRTRVDQLPCGYGSPSGWGCGEHIDTMLPHTHKRSFTADHDIALSNGGKLVGQVLVPMHLDCNARKSDNQAPEVWAAT